MRVGERGQVTIPKDIRDRFGLTPNSEIDFHVENGSIVLRKAPKHLDLEKWRGRCKKSFHDLGYSSVNEFMEDVRGR
jgi:AbrB family looped-hinge helix DNA binding protein